jgi:hypothetical protein
VRARIPVCVSRCLCGPGGHERNRGTCADRGAVNWSRGRKRAGASLGHALLRSSTLRARIGVSVRFSVCAKKAALRCGSSGVHFQLFKGLRTAKRLQSALQVRGQHSARVRPSAQVPEATATAWQLAPPSGLFRPRHLSTARAGRGARARASDTPSNGERTACSGIGGVAPGVYKFGVQARPERYLSHPLQVHPAPRCHTQVPEKP